MVAESQEPFIVRDNTLIVMTWPEQGEYTPIRRASGRIAWPFQVSLALSRKGIREKFDEQAAIGQRFSNDHEVVTFASYTQTWFDKIANYPALDDVLKITRRKPFRPQVLKLRDVLADFPLHDRPNGPCPACKENHDFADALLIHVKAVLHGHFKAEFPHQGLENKSSPEDVTAVEKLFAEVNRATLDERGKRKFPDGWLERYGS